MRGDKGAEETYECHADGEQVCQAEVVLPNSGSKVLDALEVYQCHDYHARLPAIL